MTSNAKGLILGNNMAGDLTQNSQSNELTAQQEMHQFISFTIGDEEYGVEILAVREITAWSDTTDLPNTPEYMRGVLNLRGLIVPIFDLRSRFGLGLTDVTPMHVIIIVKVDERMVGILVDAVSDILSVVGSDIQNVPEMNRNIDDEYLSGLVTVEDRMVALLDVKRLFSTKSIESGIAIGEARASGKD